MELIKVTEAKYFEGYKIAFKFSDGRKKTIDLENELWGEVFEPLKDINVFKRFTLNPFTIQWENGADFDPEFLYHYGETKKEKVS
ncbi:MAG: DUF2442 domain-containing protein [Bacteroidales bacterium]